MTSILADNNFHLRFIVIFGCVCNSITASTFVAFTQGQSVPLSLNTTTHLVLNEVITNISAPLQSDGSFKCVTPGLYAFHFYTTTEVGDEVWMNLYINDRYISSAYSSTSRGHSANAGNSVFLHLNYNDSVSIRTMDNNPTTLYGSDHDIYTSFTGALISMDSKESNTNRVAFVVGLGHSYSANGNGEFIEYDKIITNIGNGYNKIIRMFLAPVEGTYIFHYHSNAQTSGDVELSLYHNHNYVNSDKCYTSSSRASCGNTVILHLQKGDIVYMKGRSVYGNRMYGAAKSITNTFSGSLLAETASNPKDADNHTSFSAGVTQTLQTTGVIVLDHVFSNRGNAFSASTGVFTAPSEGVYMFHFHAYSSNDPIKIDLYKNYHYVLSLYEDNSDNPFGSNAVVLKLAIGDEVYLRSMFSIYGGTNKIYCTFSGFLLPTNLQTAHLNPLNIVG